MKTRPIIFQPWKAEWLHNLPLDYEAQTRRVVKCSNSFVNGHRCDKKYWGGLNLSRSGSNHGTYLQTLLRHSDDPSGENRIYKVCPRWQVGDRLRVRESFCFHKNYDRFSPHEIPPNSTVWYKTDNWYKTDKDNFDSAGRPRSPVHMPRWVSRTLLEVTAVKVERIQEISHKDICAEGVIIPVDGVPIFQPVWDSINGKKYPWKINPQVWVYTVRRVKE